MSSQDMPSSWRSFKLASSRIQSYIQPRVGPQVERAKAWAGQQIRSRRGGDEAPGGEERVNLFPGWAVRRYRIGSDDAFELEVFISGFAASYRSEETATRSQRAFIRLAKGFAALPKLTADAIDPDGLSKLTPSTEELLAQKHLPPRPTEIPDNFDLEDLERQFRHANRRSSGTSSASSSRSSSPDSRTSMTASSTSSSSPTDSTGAPPMLPAAAMPAQALRKLHANLESRLRPFWSTALSNRIVEVSLFASPHNGNNQQPHPANDSDFGAVASGTAVTGPDGSFQMKFKVLWEDLCLHPTALHIAFGERYTEHDLIVQAQLAPVQYVSPTPSRSLTPDGYRPEHKAPVPKSIYVPITCSPIRVISDIDDTVKLSNVLSGARAVFNNVFVKDLTEGVIPEMSEFYNRMWSKGVRFHYVSNGPYELLPVINEFLTLSQLPSGSIKLKSYGGRSLFNGLLSAPADRKRAGVMEVLESFPESRFFLIGDTGEQDLELYAELAHDRPNQILAVLVRDVDTGERIEDPTGVQPPSETIPIRPEAIAQTLEKPGMLRTMSGSLANKASSWASGSSSSSSGASAPSTSRTSSLSTTTKADEIGYFTQAPPKYTEEPDRMSIHSTTGQGGTPIAEQPKPMAGLQIPTTPGAGPMSSISSAGSNLGTPGAGPYTPYSGSLKSAASASRVSLTEADRKKYTLQMRVYMARTRMPCHIPLRIFRDPKECVEVDRVFEREGM